MRGLRRVGVVVASLAVATAGVCVGLTSAASGAAHQSAWNATARTGQCPSIPQTAPKGYRIAVHDDFNFSSINLKRWYQWAGEPGSDPYGWWSTPRDVAANGMLWLQGTWVRSGGNPRWSNGGEVTRGVGSKHAQTYGQYVWCMRSDHMPGTETDVLLWPADGNRWPPEIDLYESAGDAWSFATTIHYGTRQQNNVMQQQVLGRDATQWHVYRAVWAPGLVQLYEDGALVTSLSNAKVVPHLPMRLDFQTQAIQSGATVGSTLVAWVVEYAKSR
jgi:beta-glucanase (GH16 family)